MKRSILLLLLILVFPLVLVACDNGGGGAEDVELPESITIATSFNYSATVFLPAEWPARASQDTDEFIICNHGTCGADFIGGNQILGNLFIFAGETLPTAIPAEGSLEDVMEIIIALTRSEENINRDDIETFELNEKEGASIYFIEGQDEAAVEFNLIVVREDEINGYIIMSMSGAEGEVQQFENFLRAIATSVDLTPLSG